MLSATNMVVYYLQLCQFFYRLVIDEALVSRLVLHLDISSHFFGPLCIALLHNWDFLPWLLRQRYCCWTDWVFFWVDHAFSYKHGCLIPSTLSLMFFYRLVFNGAVVFRVVFHLVDTSLTFLGPSLCVALLHNWEFLPWLLRQRFCFWTHWVFCEDHAFSYKHGCLIPSTLSLMFFYRLVFNGAVVFRVVLLLIDTSLTFLGPSLCVALLHNWEFLPWLLRQRFCFWTHWVFCEDHAFSYKHGCLIPSTWSLFFFYRLVSDGAVVFRVVLHLVDFFGAIIMCRSAPQLRFSTLVTKRVILLLDWLGLLLRRPCV